MHVLFPSKRHIVGLDKETSCAHTRRRERRMQHKEDIHYVYKY